MKVEKIREAVAVHNLIDRLEVGGTVQEYYLLNMDSAAVRRLEDRLTTVVQNWFEERQHDNNRKRV